jgi:hypothetical protein
LNLVFRADLADVEKSAERSEQSRYCILGLRSSLDPTPSSPRPEFPEQRSDRREQGGHGCNHCRVIHKRSISKKLELF